MSEVSSPTVEVMQRAQGIALLCLDVDGVLTDGKLYVLSDGVEAKTFHIRDGLGLKMLMTGGVKTAIITGRKSASAQARAKELGLDYFFEGVENKLRVVKDLMATLSIAAQAVAFMGDDLPDLASLRACGLAVTVADAPDIMKRNAHFVTRGRGGDGAVREVCELILQAKDLLQSQLETYRQ